MPSVEHNLSATASLDLGTLPVPAAFAKQRQADFEIAFFGAILAERPGNTDALHALAWSVASKGRRQQALKLAVRLTDLRPHDGDAQFTLACAQSSCGMVEPAFGSLRRALELGWDAFDSLLEARALRTLQSDRRFVALIEEFGGIRD